MTIPIPRSSREFFELFRQYVNSGEIDELLKSISWNDVLPHQIYWLMLQRLPEATCVSVSRPGYSAQAHAKAALLSAEFQRSIVQLVANAYPEKKRIIHIHIQKTAGLDLKEKLATSLPALHISLLQDEITSKQVLFTSLKDIFDKLQYSELLYVGGHKELNWYLKYNLYRYGDQLFAVVRHPHDIVISYINFIIGCFVSDPQLTRYDTRDWAGVIGLNKMPDLSNRDNIIQIASTLLFTREAIIRPNFLATYLGHGTADSAFELMARTNIEITDVTRYNKWLSERWGIDSDTRMNRSVPFIAFDTFNPSEQDYIREICDQDMLLYSKIMASLNKKGIPYTYGAEIG
jgi:hypothetical protein